MRPSDALWSGTLKWSMEQLCAGRPTIFGRGNHADCVCAIGEKAATLKKPERLPAWLHRSMMIEFARLMRRCHRDRENLRRLAEASLPTQEYEGWKDAVPCIDQALNQLSKTTGN